MTGPTRTPTHPAARLARLLLAASLLVVIGLAPFQTVAAQSTAAQPDLSINVPSLSTAADAAVFVRTGPPVVVSPNLTISAANPIVNARVMITNNFFNGDVLSIQGQAGVSGTINGLTWTYNSTTGVMLFNGTASPLDLQAALRLVTFSTNSGDDSPRTVRFSLGSALSNPLTGHFYEYVPVTNISWSAARLAASTRSLFGLTGYLATIDSAAENSFISTRLQATGWLGGSDDPAMGAPGEGRWSWVTGPEAGLLFWSSTGGTANGRFVNWASGEPNNFLGQEHYLELLADGTWNDRPNTSPSISGYIVEYGGLPIDPDIQITGDVDVVISPAPLPTATPIVTLPTATLPSLPTVTVPTLPTATVAAPTVTVPTVTVPTLPTATVAAPTVTVPTVTVPTLPTATVEVPTVTIPTVTVPTLPTATVEVPTVTIPTVTVPTLPTVTVPTLPTAAPTATPSLPTVTVPTVTLPTVTLPTVTVPALPTATPAQPTATPVQPTPVQPALPRLTSGEVSTYLKGGAAVIVSPNLVVTGTGTITGAMALITDNFAPGDRLGIQGQGGTSGMIRGMSWSYNSAAGVLTLSGTTTAANMQAALRQVTFQKTDVASFSAPRKVRFVLGNALRNPANGNYYEYVAAPGISWTQAKAAAAGRKLFGLQGYLTTVASASENSFITSRFGGQSWIAASDDLTQGTVENYWIWTSGPEAGTLFAIDGVGAVESRYSNWAPGEPDNSSLTGENFAFLASNGQWSDYTNNTFVNGYVVEYGGMDGDPALQISGDATVTIALLAPTMNSLPPINSANASAYPVSGTCLPGATVTINIEGVGKTVVCAANGTFSTTLDVRSVPDSSNVPVATSQSDGSASSTPNSASTIKDTVAPAMAISTSGKLRTGTPVITGTAEQGALVMLVIDRDNNPATTADRVTYETVAGPDGNWAVDLAKAAPSSGQLPPGGLAPGSTAGLSATARDTAGNTSAPSTRAVSILPLMYLPIVKRAEVNPVP
ncbi:MAG: hypothetical protein OHK0022_12840 [Roseiflexaceae bacterium]